MNLGKGDNSIDCWFGTALNNNECISTINNIHSLPKDIRLKNGQILEKYIRTIEWDLMLKMA